MLMNPLFSLLLIILFYFIFYISISDFSIASSLWNGKKLAGDSSFKKYKKTIRFNVMFHLSVYVYSVPGISLLFRIFNLKQHCVIF